MRPEVRRACEISSEVLSRISGDRACRATLAASASSAVCDTVRPVAVHTLRAAIAAIERGETLQRIGERDLAAARRAQRMETGCDESSFEAAPPALAVDDEADAPLRGAPDGSGDLEPLEHRSAAMPLPVAVVHRGAWCDGAMLPTGWVAIDAALGGGLPLGGVHEWVPVDGALPPGAGDAVRAGGVPLASPPVRKAEPVREAEPVWEIGWFPPLGVAMALLWRLIESAHWRSGARILWVGARVRPLPQALLRPVGVSDRGAEPPPDRRLLEASWVVDRPPRTDLKSLPRGRWGRGGGGDMRSRPHAGDGVPWLLEQAIRNPGVAAVVADASGLSMAASRRLHLAAQCVALDGAATLVLLLRPPWEAKAISAALTRWRVSAGAAPDAVRGSGEAIGGATAAGTGQWLASDASEVAAAPPSWRVVLDRCKSHRRGEGSSTADRSGTGPWMHGERERAAVVDAATAMPPSIAIAWLRQCREARCR